MNETKDPTAITTPPAATPAIKVISTLDELQGMVNEKFHVEITLAGREPIRVPGRHLTPAERAVTRDMMDGVVPPLIKGAKAEDDRHDFNNPGFIRERNRVANTVRAMEIYWAYEFIAKGKPNLREAKDIHEYVQSILSESVLIALYAALKDGGLRKVVLVNFTSADSLLS